MAVEELGDYVAQLRKALADSQQQIAASRQRLRELVVKTDSRDGSVSLTLDGSSDITELTFRDDSYQDLTRDELSTLLVGVIREGRAEVQRRLLDLLPPSPVTGLTPQQLMDPATEVDSALTTDLFPWLSPGQGGGVPRG